MPQENAKPKEIGVGQIGQDLNVDRIVTKCRLVLRQPEATQPGSDVHACRPATIPPLGDCAPRRPGVSSVPNGSPVGVSSTYVP
jgi:hypothetical protein